MAIHGLYGELAASLVRATTDGWAWGAASARAGARLNAGGSQSAFEAARLMLKHFGLATADDKLAIDAVQVV
ncbi:hypothetical protein MESS2_1370012 [Mesorhizobium metallidurans STM 2683]|uniref:Uncharacterized protein n=1 Tax=Mesorhizobium metallidurans STM 2683 TaxID=1297569 RepID=M5EKI3_9HYPH|nr:hypothetical protein MESS2_1370012 [Mesorhizobium metallidurans STM 2683]